MPVPAGGTPASSGLCSPWVDATAVMARPDMAGVAADLAAVEQACVDASALLYQLSGAQFPGVCTSTVRPFDRSYRPPASAFLDGLRSGRMVLDSLTAATNGAMYGSGGLDLGLYPIRAIITVTIDGQALDPDLYRVDGQRWLIRRDLLAWPVWQLLDLPDTEVGTFSVTVVHGADPPPNGVSAAAKLAAEFTKDRTPGASSSLPRRITSLTRQNVSITNVDPMAYLKDGLTGIWQVDVFLQAVNPGKQKAPPLVWSPDLPRRRRV